MSYEANASTFWVKPAHGLSVRDPMSLKTLPEEGAEVLNNSFWQRRIRDGDVTVVEGKTKKPAAKPKAGE